MFDYPMALISSSDYDEIEVGPDATTEEIIAAKLRAVRELDYTKRELDRSISRAHAAIEGLPEKLTLVKRLEQSSSPEQQRQLIAERSELARLQSDADQREPRLAKWKAHREQLEREIRRINSLSILSPEKRQEYDRYHPPFEILQLVDLTSDRFAAEVRTMLWALRHDLARAMEQLGHPVYHPSDLTRTDFSGDFVWLPMLDD